MVVIDMSTYLTLVSNTIQSVCFGVELTTLEEISPNFHCKVTMSK